MSTQRHANVSIRFSAEELEQVRSSAAVLGLPLSSYIRAMSLGESPRPRPGQVNRDAIHQLARVGNNLNQLARFANTHGHLPSARQLDEVLALVRERIRELSS